MMEYRKSIYIGEILKVYEDKGEEIYIHINSNKKEIDINIEMLKSDLEELEYRQVLLGKRVFLILENKDLNYLLLPLGYKLSKICKEIIYKIENYKIRIPF